MTAAQIPPEDQPVGMTPADTASWQFFYAQNFNRCLSGQTGFPSGDVRVSRAFAKFAAREALAALQETLSATRAGVLVGMVAPNNPQAAVGGIFAPGAAPTSGGYQPVRQGTPMPTLDDGESQLWDRPTLALVEERERERRVALGVQRLHALIGTRSKSADAGRLTLADTADAQPFIAQRAPAVRPFALPPISNREALLRDTLNQQREKFARGELPGQQAAPAQTAWPTQAQYADRPTSYRLADSAPPRWAQSELPHVLSEGELAVLQRVKVYAKQGARKPGEPLFFEP